jgi:hypothetical protein
MCSELKSLLVQISEKQVDRLTIWLSWGFGTKISTSQVCVEHRVVFARVASYLV